MKLLTVTVGSQVLLVFEHFYFILVKQVTVTSYTYTSQYPSASMEIH